MRQYGSYRPRRRGLQGQGFLAILFCVVATLALNGLILLGAAGIVIAAFAIPVAFNWGVFWWLVLIFGVSFAGAVLTVDS